MEGELKMKINRKIMTGMLAVGLLTTGVLGVQAEEEARGINITVPGLNGTNTAGKQTKVISDMDGYLNIYEISGDNKMDGRAETALHTSTGPWVRLSHDNKGYLLPNSIKKDAKITARFSSDLTTYLPITVTGSFQGN